ncbi:MAG TPA: tetratricopeptide repeat protein [Polyangia bacterium]|jgi:tetratricopeptide (TPR) repeat protein
MADRTGTSRESARGGREARPLVEELYTFRDVAQLLGVDESRLRYWSQTGFVGPSLRRSGRQYYTFMDVVSVRAARDLLDAGLTLQRVRRNLEALRAALPSVDRPLLRLRVCSDGDRLVVVGEEAVFEPSGQLIMDFALGQLATPRAEVQSLYPEPAAAPGDPAAPRTAYAWFQLGVGCERAGDADGAARAFRAALTEDPSLAAAHTNLGRLAHAAGDRARARQAFVRALELDPEQPEARFNLANVYDEEEEVELALAEYRRVVTAWPDYADARYNLGCALARAGAADEARRHLGRYLEADPDSEWAEAARRLLAELDASVR